MHVDALRVENCLFFSRLRCRFTQQAAGQALGFHDDGILGQRWEHWGQVKVHLAHWQDQVNLETGTQHEQMGELHLDWLIKKNN